MGRRLIAVGVVVMVAASASACRTEDREFQWKDLCTHFQAAPSASIEAEARGNPSREERWFTDWVVRTDSATFPEERRSDLKRVAAWVQTTRASNGMKPSPDLIGDAVSTLERDRNEGVCFQLQARW